MAEIFLPTNYNEVMKETNIQYLIATLSSRNEWVSAQALASYLHTTTRSVRNYVTEVNERYSSPVIRTSHKGYKWDGASKASSPFLKQEDSFDSPEKRRRHVLRELCFLNTINEEGNCTIQGLCDKMAVSDHTLMADIEPLREELRSSRLHLRIRKDALSINGKESDIRSFIFDLISSRHETLNREVLQKVYPAIPVGDYGAYLHKVLNRHGLDIDAYHKDPLFLMIIIQVMRTENRHPVSPDEVQIPDIEKRDEYAAASEILDSVSKQYSLPFSRWERYYLTVLLIATCHRISFESVSFPQEIVDTVERVLFHLENHDQISYHEDGFPLRVYDYVERLKDSCAFHISVVNPLRSSLRNYAPVLHNYAAWIMIDLKETFHLQPDADQISFFEMLLLSYRRKRKTRHFHISCTLVLPSCYGLEETLADKIQDHFHRLISIEHVIDSCRVSDLPESDLYISLLPIKDRPHSVVISPALTAENYRAIQNEISLIEHEKRYRSFEIYLRSYSKEEFFERNRSFSSKEEVVDHICRKLQEEHCVREGFKEDILRREETDSTSYHHMIAVPHAITQNVQKNAIYVLMSDRPIPWDSHRVNMVVLVAMERQLNDDFELFLDVLIRLFESRNNMKFLLEATDHRSFLEKLEKIGKGAA